MSLWSTAGGAGPVWSQGKKSLLLSLTKPEGIALAKELIKKSEVVVENFATGVMDQLGLGYEELTKIKPDLTLGCGISEDPPGKAFSDQQSAFSRTGS